MSTQHKKRIEQLKINKSFRKFPSEFNIIPIPENSKIPNLKWENYQNKRYTGPITENNSNYAVICGKISNNLVVLDLDLKDKKYFQVIFKQFQEAFSNLSKTLIVSTPHGFHFYYYTKDFTLDRKPNKNARYNEKNKFTGSLKTAFGYYLKGFDILGNNGYAITWNSKINDLFYECINENPILSITEEDFEKIQSFFLLEKQKRVRKPFLDMLNGKIEIEDYASTTGIEEFQYWKALYRELYWNAELLPNEVFEGLSKNQQSFDLQKTETQLKYHDFKEKPYTNEQLSKMFPEYQFGKPEHLKKNKKESIEEEVIEIEKIFSEEEIREFEIFWRKKEEERYKFIDFILRFYIIGEKELKNALLVFFLKFGDQVSEDLMNRVSYHGDPSAGKSYIYEIVIMKLFPEESIIIFDASSDKSLRYLLENDLKDKCTIFLREMERDTNIIGDLKKMGDNDPIWQYVDFLEKRTKTIKGKKLGQATTYSFENTTRDLQDRSWDIIPDQSYEQTELIKKFKLQNKSNKLDRYIEEKNISKDCEFLKDAIRYLKQKEKIEIIIPYADKLNPLFSKYNLRARRDIDKLPELIEIITTFNQFNRIKFNFDNKKWVISEWEDLRKALEISKDLFIKMALDLDQVKKDILDFMEYTRTEISKSGTDEVEREYTIKEIHNFLSESISQHENTTRYKLNSLGSNGYISIKSKKGSPTKYKKLKDYEELNLDENKIKDEINSIIQNCKKKYNNLIQDNPVKD